MRTIRFFLLGFLLVLLVTVSACGPAKPALKEYQPDDDSLFKITFFYSVDWNWIDDPDPGKTYAGITAFAPYPAGEGANEKGRLAGIDVRVDARPQERMQERINSHLKGIETLERLDLRDDQTLQIDGHYARWLTIVNTWEYENPGVTYVQEFIYLLAEDRYYIITLYIPESEVGGRFHTEFKAMVASINILP